MVNRRTKVPRKGTPPLQTLRLSQATPCRRTSQDRPTLRALSARITRAMSLINQDKIANFQPPTFCLTNKSLRSLEDLKAPSPLPLRGSCNIRVSCNRLSLLPSMTPDPISLKTFRVSSLVSINHLRIWTSSKGLSWSKHLVTADLDAGLILPTDNN